MQEEQEFIILQVLWLLQGMKVLRYALTGDSEASLKEQRMITLQKVFKE